MVERNVSVVQRGELPDMTGKWVVVTGATAGIGLAAVMALARQGAQIIGVGRDAQRCRDAENAVRRVYPQVKLNYLLANLSLQAQVRALARDIRAVLEQNGADALDVLVNNAGTYSQKFVQTPDGLELTLAVNHFAPFLLTNELLPLLKAAPHGRVITVSSDSHYRTWIDFTHMNSPLIYNGLWAYKVSKLANVLFTSELNRRASGSALRAFAVDPGLVNTEIGFKNQSGLSRLVWSLRRKHGTPPEVPARTIRYLASEKSVQNAEDIYWRDCRPKAPSRAAQNRDTARQLWEVSRKICAI